jgi:ankyrin repeat protein
MLDWMLDRDADITRTDESRRNARGRHRMMGGGKDCSLEVLNRAASQGNVELFEHLVHRGADPSRSLALHRVSECNDSAKSAAMIDYFLDKHQFDIEADNRQLLKTGPRPDFGTPLHVAIYNKNIDAVSYLLKRGADPESGVDIAIGSSVIMSEGWLPALDALLDAGANVDDAFDRAVDSLQVEAAKACLSRGTVSPSMIESHQAQGRPRSSGSYSTLIEEEAEMRSSSRRSEDLLVDAQQCTASCLTFKLGTIAGVRIPCSRTVLAVECSVHFMKPSLQHGE